MKIHRLLPIAVIALGGLSLGSGCPTIPSLKDRVVELAVNLSTTLPPFHGDGPGAHFTSTDPAFDFNNVDLSALLSGTDVDLSDVTGIKLAKVSYAVTTGAGIPLTITNGQVTVHRGTAADVVLIQNFTQDVTNPTGFVMAPLQPAGVDVLNQVLADLLASAKAGTPLANPLLKYTVSGDASNATAAYHFQWTLKLEVSVSGKTKKITVLT